MKSRHRIQGVTDSYIYRCALILLFSIIFLSQCERYSVSAARNPEESKSAHNTAYACEGKVLEIECEEGSVIQPIRANYGRFSISICNEHGNLEWEVNCRSPNSYDVISTRCGQQRHCKILTNSSIFADPCPQTQKYLEVHYECKETSSEGKPSTESKSSHSHRTNLTPNELTTDEPLVTKNYRPPVILPTSRPSSTVPSSRSPNVIKNSSPNLTPSLGGSESPPQWPTSRPFAITNPTATPSSSSINAIPTVRSPASSTGQQRAKPSPSGPRGSSSPSLSINPSLSSSPSSAVRWFPSSGTSTPKPSIVTKFSSTSTPTTAIGKRNNNNNRLDTYSTTSRPNQAFFDSLAANSNKTKSGHSTTFTHRNTESPSMISSSSMNKASDKSVTNEPSNFDSYRPVVAAHSDNYLPHPSLTSSSSSPIYCAPIVLRGLRWPQTRIGSTALIRCLVNGTAKWHCPLNSQGSWAASGPDFSRCVSRSGLSKLEKSLESGDSLPSIANLLVEETRPVSSSMVPSSSKQPMFGGDILVVVKLVDDLIQRIQLSTAEISEEKRHELTREMAEYVVKITENLMDTRNALAWQDLEYVEYPPADRDHYEPPSSVSDSRVMMDGGEELRNDASDEGKRTNIANSTFLYLMHLVSGVSDFFPPKQSAQNDLDNANPHVFLVVIGVSCIIAILLFIITFILLLISRVKSHRQTIYKNLCCQLTACELILCVITFQTWTDSSLVVCALLAISLHYLLQSVFNLIVIDCIRVYSCAHDNCDKIGKLLAKRSIALYLITYGLPIVVLISFYLVDPRLIRDASAIVSRPTFPLDISSHSNPFSYRHQLDQTCWFGTGISSVFTSYASLWIYLPVLGAFLASLCVIVATIFGKSVERQHHLSVPGMDMKGSNFYGKVHRWHCTVYLLVVQCAFWSILIMFISSPLNSVALAAIFCTINLVSALSVLYVSFFNSRLVRNNVRKSLTSCYMVTKCFGRGTSDNIGPSPLAPMSTPMTACFYSLDPSHLMSPPSPIVKLTSSSSSSSSARCLHLNGRDDRTCSQETLPIHQINSLGPRHIPEVSPYAPPVPIYRHEYEDIASVMDHYNYGQSRHTNSPYYHTTRSPIYYSERKQVMMN
ncbi:uncharacterized protein LOC141851076 [Brevipalpus obovatus]|uniref:uncharacterized protein LOC141851076 n=1 Tax=Brevipalpus obovatus TaxID=246614 RepID=UPI003D9ED279